MYPEVCMLIPELPTGPEAKCRYEAILAAGMLRGGAVTNFDVQERVWGGVASKIDDFKKFMI